MIVKCYRKVAQGSAIVRNGVGGSKVTFTGIMVVPVIHRAERMDISVKRVKILRKGEEGLVCKDNMRADIEVAFFDDRLESIPYDQPTDLVAISVETYTAKRAYQIATEYRRRGVPIVGQASYRRRSPMDAGRNAQWARMGGRLRVAGHLVCDGARRGRRSPGLSRSL